MVSLNLDRIACLTAFFVFTFASSVNGQLELNNTNLPKKLNYKEYISQLMPMMASIDIESVPLGGGIVPPGTKTYTTGVRSTADGTDFCGGSLITRKHVLTAAHCMSDDIQYVSVGTHFVSGTKDGEQIKVVKQTVHPKYVSGNNSYDFLVLELEKASSFLPVKLPKADGMDIIGCGDNATVMGWGATSQGGRLSSELRRVNVPLVSNLVCSMVLDVDSTMLCAGGESGIDSCQGDSGGPLVREQVDGDVLIGVVSWGSGCGRGGYPGVYARVSAALEWLSSVAPRKTFCK